MHSTTAKLITLARTEELLACGWPKGAQAALAAQAKALRHEIPPHILTVNDRLKAERKDIVVGVFDGVCGGCHAPLSKAALARLSGETEVSRCEHCERFLYLAPGHDLASPHPHPFTGGHTSG